MSDSIVINIPISASPGSNLRLTYEYFFKTRYIIRSITDDGGFATAQHSIHDDDEDWNDVMSLTEMKKALREHKLKNYKKT